MSIIIILSLSYLLAIVGFFIKPNLPRVKKILVILHVLFFFLSLLIFILSTMNYSFRGGYTDVLMVIVFICTGVLLFGYYQGIKLLKIYFSIYFIGATCFLGWGVISSTNLISSGLMDRFLWGAFTVITLCLIGFLLYKKESKKHIIRYLSAYFLVVFIFMLSSIPMMMYVDFVVSSENKTYLVNHKFSIRVYKQCGGWGCSNGIDLIKNQYVVFEKAIPVYRGIADDPRKLIHVKIIPLSASWLHLKLTENISESAPSDTVINLSKQ